jgi:tRNA modification GTPase
MAETIFALSTAPGKSGVAMVRVSGPDAPAACKALCGAVPVPRRASLRVLRDPSGEAIDEAIVLFFPQYASFTGEPVVEFQTHGSQAVVAALMRELGAIPGFRPAEAGEFTRRAFQNGRLDLTQVEALGDLLEAETEAQRRQAMRGLSGALAMECSEWRALLLRAMALLEVTIDFADEEVPVDVFPEVRALLGEVMQRLDRQLRGVHAAERVRSGFEVAIVGAPNVGKSTLLNRLAGREAAITSEYAGTTRDVIEVRMDLGGLPVTLLDTAGLRVATDAVEAIGVERARERAILADLRIFLSLGDEAVSDLAQPGDIHVRAKADLGAPGDGVSGLTGQGVDDLIARITEVLRMRSQRAALATHVRHESALRRGKAALEVACARLAQGETAVDLAAEEIHSAIRALDSLVGRIDVEAVLGEIFASFCLGK